MMRYAILLVVAIATNLVTGSAIANNEILEELESQNLTSSRDSRFLSLFTTVRFGDYRCDAANNLEGTCMKQADCSREGGTASGSCARGFGVCCVFSLSCGATTSRNNSYFSSNGLALASTNNNVNGNAISGLGQQTICSLNVNRISTDICQLRMEFLAFTISQPDDDGLCNVDRFMVTGGGNTSPTICGDNANQHMLIAMRPGQNQWTLRFTINSQANNNVNRNWNIRLIQIPCNSELRSDPNCLQYFTESSGRIRSFNFDFGSSSNSRGRQLSSQNYAICVRQEDGACGIQYTACTDSSVSATNPSTSFSLTGNLNISPPNEALQGIFCQWDYLEIPAGYNSQSNVLYTTDRFCGTAFNTGFLARDNVPITSRQKPFQLRYVTDGLEATNNPNNVLGPDGRNNGFCLNYQQLQTC